ncbi:MAG TPA: acyltransferase, partial [Chloroflexota bacterium]|nr:acyltransferase [Chloroflexota bacterium]
GICLALIAISVVYKLVAYYVDRIPAWNWSVYFSVIPRLDGLALGMLLAVVLAARQGRPLIGGPLPMLLRIAALVGVIVLCHVAYYNSLVNLCSQTLWAVAMLVVLGSTVLGPRNSLWERALAIRPLQILGLLSYSIYLWHEPIMLGLSHYLVFTSNGLFALSATALIVASLGVAFASYYAVERPFALLRHTFTRDGRLIPRYTEPLVPGASLAAGNRRG